MAKSALLSAFSPFDNYRDAGPTSASFYMFVDGIRMGSFREVSGLELKVEVVTIEEGGENGFVHQLPGRMTWPNLVLKRGVTRDNSLVKWIQETSGAAFEKKKKLDRRTMALVLASSAGIPLRSWSFEDAFPVRWAGPEFSLTRDEFITEEIEIAHHGFTVEHWR